MGKERKKRVRLVLSSLLLLELRDVPKLVERPTNSKRKREREIYIIEVFFYVMNKCVSFYFCLFIVIWSAFFLLLPFSCMLYGYRYLFSTFSFAAAISFFLCCDYNLEHFFSLSLSLSLRSRLCTIDLVIEFLLLSFLHFLLFRPLSSLLGLLLSFLTESRSPRSLARTHAHSSLTHISYVYRCSSANVVATFLFLYQLMRLSGCSCSSAG